jgi:hypothetical protein
MTNTKKTTMTAERPTRWDGVLERITPELCAQFQSDGVVLLRQILHPEWLMLLELGLARVLGDSGMIKHKFFAGTEGEFTETVRNFEVAPELQRLLYDSPIPDIMGRLMGSPQVWLYSDEFFIKDHGGCERTPWHQDTPYFPVAGEQLSSMWISLDPLAADECLEYVVGSHRQTMYDGFNPAKPEDPSSGFYGEGLPILPDIQSQRERWPIVSWEIQPGDVIVSHPGIIHGGGPTSLSGRRRAWAVRCYGEDVVYATRPSSRPTVPLTPGLSLHLSPGDKLRSPWYPQLRPVPPHQAWG